MDIDFCLDLLPEMDSLLVKTDVVNQVHVLDSHGSCLDIDGVRRVMER